MSCIGFDFIWIDTEHGAIDYAELVLMVANAWNGGSAPVVRVTMHDRNHVKKVLEIGPAGIIFPMLDTAEEVDTAIQSTLYPPEGNRGFGPLRAVRYGLDDDLEYLAKANQSLCRFIQQETAAAIENLPTFVHHPYIDGFIFGPCGLANSINCPGDLYNEKVLQLVRQAATLIQPTGKRIGVCLGGAAREQLQLWQSLGCSWFCLGN